MAHRLVSSRNIQLGAKVIFALCSPAVGAAGHELLSTIFAFLPARDLAKAEVTCVCWYQRDIATACPLSDNLCADVLDPSRFTGTKS